jgi:hypothetical protein
MPGLPTSMCCTCAASCLLACICRNQALIGAEEASPAATGSATVERLIVVLHADEVACEQMLTPLRASCIALLQARAMEWLAGRADPDGPPPPAIYSAQAFGAWYGQRLRSYAGFDPLSPAPSWQHDWAHLLGKLDDGLTILADLRSARLRLGWSDQHHGADR